MSSAANLHDVVRQMIKNLFRDELRGALADTLRATVREELIWLLRHDGETRDAVLASVFAHLPGAAETADELLVAVRAQAQGAVLDAWTDPPVVEEALTDEVSKPEAVQQLIHAVSKIVLDRITFELLKGAEGAGASPASALPPGVGGSPIDGAGLGQLLERMDRAGTPVAFAKPVAAESPG